MRMLTALVNRGAKLHPFCNTLASPWHVHMHLSQDTTTFGHQQRNMQSWQRRAVRVGLAVHGIPRARNAA